MVGIGVIVVGLVLGLAGIGLTTWMIVRIWKHRPRRSAAPWIAALVVGIAMAFVAFGAIIGLVTALGAVGGERVDPSQKARILAEGISAAMNCTAFGILLWVPSMIVAFLLTRQKKPRSGESSS